MVVVWGKGSQRSKSVMAVIVQPAEHNSLIRLDLRDRGIDRGSCLFSGRGPVQGPAIAERLENNN